MPTFSGMLITIVFIEPLVSRRACAPLALQEERPMITNVKFVSIPTRDQDRALQFWTEQVGFTLMSDQPFSDKQRWIELAVGNSPTRFVLFTPDGQEDRIGSFFNGALACDDVEATWRQLSERGVEF